MDEDTMAAAIHAFATSSDWEVSNELFDWAKVAR